MINLTVNITGNQGTVNYNWTMVQTDGTIVPGVSLTYLNNNASITHSSSLVFLGANAVSGAYEFTVVCIAVDTKQCSLNEIKKLYFNPICQLEINEITIN